MLITLLAAAVVQAATPDAQAHVRRFANDRVSLLKTVLSDAQIAKAIQDRNAEGATLDDIRRVDEQWSRNPAFPLRKELAANACAERVRELTRHDPAVVEVIVMDRHGANVCITRETSDYWQGDEAKFRKTAGERRELFIDTPAFDASTGVYAVQLSGASFAAGEPVGAVTLTLRVPRAR